MFFILYVNHGLCIHCRNWIVNLELHVSKTSKLIFDLGLESCSAKTGWKNYCCVKLFGHITGKLHPKKVIVK